MSSKNKRAYEFLRGRLFDGFYSFGEAVSVRTISKEIGVSRQPIMTALYRLAEQGFIDITAQVGCRVANPALQDVLDFYEVFAAVESVVAGFAAQRATAAELERLEGINRQILALDVGSVHVVKDYQRLNQHFHQTLHECAHSSRIAAQQQINFDLSDFYLIQTKSFKDNLLTAGMEHDRIIKALRKRNKNQAQKLSKEHILSVAQHIQVYWQQKN